METRCLIDGEWVGHPQTFDVDDPATGDVIAKVPDLGLAEVDRAIDAAVRAFPAWRDRPAPERGACLAGMASRVRAREQELAALITRENGKAQSDALGEVRYAASFLEWFAGEAVRIYGETIPPSRADQRIVVTREPVGPCALITPWNFPAAMLTRKLGPALAAGCTVIAKPAEETPLTTIALGAIALESGVPAGVFNIVTGDAARVGGRLCAHPAIRKISFTGSTEVGRLIARGAGHDLKHVSLELGGNAPFIVFGDADPDRVIAAAMVAKFRGGGQTCVAANRFLIARDVEAAMTARLVEMCKGVEVRPLINQDGYDKVKRLVDDAIARGARRVIGEIPKDTRWVPPIVLAGVTPEMAIWREEVFGPVITITGFDGSEAEAIAMGNDTDAGLIAYVFTRDLARAERVARGLECGMVGVNEGLVSYAAAPFGGVKASGLGREGSRHGMDDYQQLKYVMVSLAR